MTGRRERKAGNNMLETLIEEVYRKFKLQFFKRIFGRFQTREASLTAVETFCVEAIYALGHPTINEFATFTRISAPNAAYKVTSLVKKGYIRKVQSQEDKREYYLEVTDRFYEYYSINTSYLRTVAERAQERFSEEELNQFERVLRVISNELMPEIILPHKRKSPSANSAPLG